MKVIYKITCVENGKFYIGSTVNKTQRWARHRRDLRSGKHPNKNMQASWEKYGEASFMFEVLEDVSDDVLLFSAEQRYLDEHVGNEYCFNHSKYADAPMRGKSGVETPNFGKPVPSGVRAKISAGLSGKKHPNWGKSLPEATREKIRQANLLCSPWKGQKHTPEARAKIAAAGSGRQVSTETRAKRSAALKGREVPLETRIRISRKLSGDGNYWYGKERPESFKEKIRKSVIAKDPSGKEMRYESIQALREATGLKPPTVNRALKSGDALVRGPFKGWQFHYAMT